MFNSIFGLSNIAGLYSGSPFMAAVGSFAYRNNMYMHRGGEMGLIGLIFILPFILLSLAVCALIIVAWWKVFEKAGRPGWAAIIPIYNLVVMLQIVGMSPLYVLLAFVPFVGGIAFFIVSIFVNIKLARAFGKDEGFAVGLILLPVVFVPILAFGKAHFKSHPHHTPPVGPTTTV